MKFKDFKNFVDRNKVTFVNLAAWGEIFLNPELLDIIRYAHQKNITLWAGSGVNGNTMSDELIKGLVDYKFDYISFSIDGASRDTYSIYRVGGNFDRVIDNIKKINAYKAERNSEFPKLNWKFIMFGHNIHDIPKAREMAGELNMSFSLADNYAKDYSPIEEKDLSFIAGELQREGTNYQGDVDYQRMSVCRSQLWSAPLISWDGKLWGCCLNLQGAFGKNLNVFKTDLFEALNHPDILYAKAMLSGQAPERADVPCARCYVYQGMKEANLFT